MYELLENFTTNWLVYSRFPHLMFLATCVIVGFFMLIKGGDFLCDHSSNIASIMGVPQVVVGLTIVSLATSTPELFTCLSALRSDSPGLVLGNIIGSNIANIGLILGVALLIGKINTLNAVSLPQRVCLLVVTVFFCAVLWASSTGSLGSINGALLLGFILMYVLLLTYFSLKQKDGETQTAPTDCENKHGGPLASFVVLILATIALWVGSDTLIFGSKSLAELAGVPEELVGFTLLAIGTSLPELAASISLVKKKRHGMLLGNVLGSNLFNLSLIGGLAGLLGPVSSQAKNPWIDYLFLLATTFIFLLWLRGKTLGKPHGFVLLLLYVSAVTCTWILNT